MTDTSSAPPLEGPDAITAQGAAVGGSGERWIWVLDPMTRKLRVPLQYLVPTQATATAGTVPSLCIAFLEGRCRHPWCRQAHVLPSMITQLRHDALHAPTCCFLHHDPHDISILTSRFSTVTIADSSVTHPVPAERIALTVGLQRYLAHSIPADLPGPNLEVPSKLICRLHLGHRCRYLEDCNNIHVCREFDLRLHPPPYMMSSLLGLTLASRTVTMCDVTFSVTPLAAGEVTDEEFHSICDAQQKIFNSVEQATNVAGSASRSPAGSSTPVAAGGTSPNLMGTPVLSFSTPPLGAYHAGASAPSGTSPLFTHMATPSAGLPSFVGNAEQLLPSFMATPGGASVAAGHVPSDKATPTLPSAVAPSPSPSPSRARPPLRVYDIRTLALPTGAGTPTQPPWAHPGGGSALPATQAGASSHSNGTSSPTRPPVDYYTLPPSYHSAVGR